MLENIKPELINQELLKNRIENMEAGYVDAMITIIQGPHFIKACEDDLAVDGITPERRKVLEEALNKNKESMKGHKIAIDQYNAMIPEARKFLTK